LQRHHELTPCRSGGPRGGKPANLNLTRVSINRCSTNFQQYEHDESTKTSSAHGMLRLVVLVKGNYKRAAKTSVKHIPKAVASPGSVKV
jgi:hypothetical protein